MNLTAKVACSAEQAALLIALMLERNVRYTARKHDLQGIEIEFFELSDCIKGKYCCEVLEVPWPVDLLKIIKPLD